MKVFISYRRGDRLALGLVGRIYERLAGHFGEANLFLDVDTITPGEDFRLKIEDTIRKADVLLALMGPEWLEILQDRQKRPPDFVKTEIELGLQHGLLVLPVLLADTDMPDARDLPEVIQELASKNAFHIDPGKDFSLHVDRLVKFLEREHESRRRGFTNSIGMEMIWCPPGEFTMGSPEDESGRVTDGSEWRPFSGTYEVYNLSETQRTVSIPEGFWIAKYPLTKMQQHQLYNTFPYVYGDGDAPANMLAWSHAVDFCTGLTNRERILPERRIYTIPSSEQWEYACRAGTTGPYAGPTLDEMGWYKGNSEGSAHPVGSKRPNPWGIHDMHGNVWEWCSGWIRRGGSFRMGADRCRSAYAFVDIPELGGDCSGVRPIALLPGGEHEKRFLEAEQMLVSVRRAAWNLIQ